MLFDIASANLTTQRQAALNSLLSEWIGSTNLPSLAAENLRAENGCSAARFENYLAAMADNEQQLRIANPSLRIVFEQVGATFALAGHQATPFTNIVFGRATLLVKFARFLAPHLDALGCFDTEQDIHTVLRRLGGTEENVAPSRFKVYFEAMRATPLGKGAMFATFATPAGTGTRPWTTPISNAEDIRNSVALGEDPDGYDYLLFAYRLPANTFPRVPTSASPGWSYQRWFRPSPTADADLHGWTVPIDARFARRPEVVHAEIDGATLVFPIYVASA